MFPFQNSYRFIILFLWLLILNNSLPAQVIDTTLYKKQATDSLVYNKRAYSKEASVFSAKKLILPTALFTSGLAIWKINGLNKIDRKVHDYEISQGFQKVSIDDYLQYSPAVAVFGLEAFGVKSKHDIVDKLFLCGISYAITGVLTGSLKYSFKRERPDLSGKNSFPSGHTATAFAGADFLNAEYGDQSTWYSVAGYSVAGITGALRTYNNKHWVSDVIAGAGIGILSTRLSYLIYPVIKKAIFKTHNFTFIPTPYYNGYTEGVKMLVVHAR